MAAFVDEHVEAAKLVADALRCGGDRSLIRHVELERAGVSLDQFGSLVSPREIARTDQDGEVLRGQFFLQSEADPLIGPCDQGDGFVLHNGGADNKSMDKAKALQCSLGTTGIKMSRLTAITRLCWVQQPKKVALGHKRERRPVEGMYLLTPPSTLHLSAQ
jgi:hypothetical protein